MSAQEQPTSEEKLREATEGVWLTIDVLRDMLAFYSQEPECPKCRTVLAFDGDKCGLCKEENRE